MFKFQNHRYVRCVSKKLINYGIFYGDSYDGRDDLVYTKRFIVSAILHYNTVFLKENELVSQYGCKTIFQISALLAILDNVSVTN